MITGNTRLLAHIGYPTQTFRSPMIYNPWFAHVGEDVVVVPFASQPDRYPALLRALFGTGNVVGALITMPHKSTTPALLDRVSVAARIAGACNARARIVEAAEIYPVIDRAYRIRSDRKQRTIVGLLLGSVLLAASLVLSLLHVYRQMQRLRQARRALSDANARLQTVNDALSDVNRTLLEANAIKEEYIAQYINRCSVYIDKLDHYRRRLMKLAQSGRTDELLRTVRSTELIADERREFYAEFDRTFLGLFPHFVEEFNALLHPADRITPKAGERLTTELRIFALIRLGITDSARIAEFLGYSVTTIYNYRSKTRGKSTLDRDAFESAVMRIG